MAAVRRGIPTLLAPCGLDMLSYGGREDKLAETKGRSQYVQDALRVQVRSNADELQQVADVIAQRLNQSAGPFTFMIPLQGWSSLDHEGRQNYDPQADAAFVMRLKEKLNNPDAVKEVDLHLYTPEFAQAAVNEFVSLYKQVIPSETGKQ
jgi:uncharacterized protein (UPF0261 family)